MVRLLAYFISIALIAAGLSWIADRPGSLHIVWQGYDIETSVFRAVVLLAAAIAFIVFLWSMARALWKTPAIIGNRIVRRRQTRGLDAVSGGLIAIGAGDSTLASRYAVQARKSLPHQPLTHLLRAQSAELSGDRATARRIYEAMLASPETEQLGLRGLFLEAEREGANEAARQFATRALKANPKLGWSSTALFEQQCKQKDWAGALSTLEHARKYAHITKADADRKRAVLLAAQAIDIEDDNADKALALALESHGLAPDLVPPAVLAGRILASRGNTGKAAKVLQKTWTKSPHPDLAATYAYARIGDSTRDRLDRVVQLAALNPHSIESPIAVATTATEARLFAEARRALEPLLTERLTQRVAILMARIEAGENGEHGRVREWLARAMNAARDPAWIADGVTSDHWKPISPVTGKLDAFLWRVPIEARDASQNEILARRLDELIALEAPPQAAPAASVTTGPKHVDKDDVVDAETVTVTVRPAPAAAAEPHTKDEPAPAAPAKEPTSAPAAAAPEATPIRIQKGDKDSATQRRAPDDPGTEPEVELEQPVARRSYRVVN
ncbi:heme biosynthesis protein HemY [Hyphomicrobium methylovorum]|uniref:heme biosynthesis protein HemY n=1 Tax=Hyphomicrobium methylovorum TaxID=84 RepID=UPI0015E778AB|nr:heme biosynthesis HemY N-terminal domain-containing protein [Hyphomicrobium methylovorum]MBA2126337.1 heme biosynthesis protein HemY [Hyphomicrobium methylovorum]